MVKYSVMSKVATNYDEITHPVGPRVRELRELHGLSRADLASRSGVSFTTIGNIERGDSRPFFATLVVIAAALQVPFESLVERDA